MYVFVPFDRPACLSILCLSAVIHAFICSVIFIVARFDSRMFQYSSLVTVDIVNNDVEYV